MFCTDGVTEISRNLRDDREQRLGNFKSSYKYLYFLSSIYQTHTFSY